MDIARIIATRSANDVAEAIDQFGAERFIEVAKNHHYHVAGRLRTQYFGNLNKALELPTIQESRQAWQLRLVIDDETAGRKAALQKLRPLALSCADNWATFVYARSAL